MHNGHQTITLEEFAERIDKARHAEADNAAHKDQQAKEFKELKTLLQDAIAAARDRIQKALVLLEEVVRRCDVMELRIS